MAIKQDIKAYGQVFKSKFVRGAISLVLYVCVFSAGFYIAALGYSSKIESSVRLIDSYKEASNFVREENLVFYLNTLDKSKVGGADAAVEALQKRVSSEILRSKNNPDFDPPYGFKIKKSLLERVDYSKDLYCGQNQC